MAGVMFVLSFLCMGLSWLAIDLRTEALWLILAAILLQLQEGTLGVRLHGTRRQETPPPTIGPPPPKQRFREAG